MNRGVMDRVINFRRPTGESSFGHSAPSKLSKSSKVFFLLNIVQVVTVGAIQTSMMVVGDFAAIDQGGMGPGRKVYMALFCVAILYTCFLCLFAVKSENFLEILAFVLQNFGFITYSFVQVYHINFKTYHGLSIKKDKKLALLAIANCITLIVLNIIFTYLAHQLFIEYGWKIYKRVRFNVRLRAAYHYYELVICLMKMSMLFVLMFAICLNQTILRDFSSSINYVASLCFVPVALIVCLLALYGIRKENKVIVIIFIFTLVIGQGFACYEIYSVGSRTCKYCKEFSKQTIDIPEEVILHVVYLASMALLMMFLLTLASLKALRNYGVGLKDHFVGTTNNSNILLMGFPGELMRSLFSSSVMKSDSFTNLPDITRSNIVVNPPAIVTPSSSHDNLKYFEDSLRRMSQSSDEASADPTSHLTKPSSISKSNSLPDRMSDQQRPSVVERLSRQASSRLHQLYYRTVSIESSHNICGCCFWKKRHAVNSFRVSFDMSGFNVSDIFGEYYSRENADSSSTETGFYNACFSPDHEAEILFSERKHYDRRPQRIYHRVSSYRREVSELVTDVILEEQEEVSPVPSRSKTLSVFEKFDGSRTGDLLSARIGTRSSSENVLNCFNDSKNNLSTDNGEFSSKKRMETSLSQNRLSGNNGEHKKRTRSRSMSSIDLS